MLAKSRTTKSRTVKPSLNTCSCYISCQLLPLCIGVCTSLSMLTHVCGVWKVLIEQSEVLLSRRRSPFGYHSDYRQPSAMVHNNITLDDYDVVKIFCIHQSRPMNQYLIFRIHIFRHSVRGSSSMETIYPYLKDNKGIGNRHQKSLVCFQLL